MGDSFKKIATIVGVAALVVTGIGVFVSPAAFGILAGVSAAANAIGLTTLAAIGVTGVSIGAIPGKNSLESTGAASRGNAYAEPGTPGHYVFGRTMVHMPLIYEETTGTAPDRVLHDIFAHAWHRISGYVSLSLATDSTPAAVTFSGNAATGAMANVLWWYRQDGSQSTALAQTSTFINSWPSTAVAKGIAHSALVWNIDDDAFTAQFSGAPNQVEIVIDGAYLYDPRLDTTAGGSGAQRFDDPSTWAFQNGNAILALLRFMIGEYSTTGDLIWGRGIEETEYDVDNFMAMASVADETRDGKPRYRLAGSHILDGSWSGFVAQWESETGGKVSKPGGVYRVWLPHDDLTPLTTISESDLLAGASIQHIPAGSINTLYNTARGRYVEPAQGYKGFPYPEVKEDASIAEDGGRKRILVHDFSWVQDVEIAQRTARLMIRRSRFQRMWTVPVGWMGKSPNYRPFTVHTLNCAETNFQDQLVRVVDRRSAFNGPTVLVVQQEDASLYDDTIPLLDPHASNTIPNRIDRLATITARRIFSDSAVDTSTEITELQHTPDGQGFNTTVVSITYVPAASGSVLVNVSGYAAYTYAAGGIYLDLQYSIQRDSSYSSFDEQHWFISDPIDDADYSNNITMSRTFAVTAGVSTTFKFMAAKLQTDDEVFILNTQMSLQAFPS